MHDLCYISPGATKVGLCFLFGFFKSNTISRDGSSGIRSIANLYFLTGGLKLTPSASRHRIVVTCTGPPG
jgi:hypothetical protein